MAEGTGQRAPDLRGHAQRAPAFFGDIDNLHLMAARNPDKVLPGAVIADLPGYDFRHLDHKFFSQFCPVALGEVRHQSEVAHPPLVDPLPDLADPHLRLFLGRSMGDQGVAHLFAGHADKVDRPVGKFPRDCVHILCDRRCRLSDFGHWRFSDAWGWASI